jgi:lysine-N-methylase
LSDDHFQPRYAKDFQCIGPDCEDSCCVGWTVYVDKASYKKYRATPKLRPAALVHIEVNPEAHNNFEHARVKLQPDGRCPFLSAGDLCNIQLQYGAEYLSQTCARYPRTLVRFDGRIESGLYLSCPEAARLVLLNPQLLPAPDQNQDQSTGQEKSGLRYRKFRLEDAHDAVCLDPADASRRLRAFTLDLLQDRTYPLWQRLFLLGTVCRRSHELIAKRSLFKIPQLLAQYATIIADGGLRAGLDGIPPRLDLQLGLVLHLIERRFQLDRPLPRFAQAAADFLLTVRHTPEAPPPQKAERFQQAYVQYYVPFEQNFPGFMENYLLNYVFVTGFPHAANLDQERRSTDPLVNYILLIMHYRLLHSLLVGAAGQARTDFSTAHAIRVVGAFARAVEHNAKYLDVLIGVGRTPELEQSDGLAVVLRN